MSRPCDRDRRQGAAERAYAALREMAVEFSFGPGAHLSEVDLAERLAVSRTPLREALNRLASERLIVAMPGQGFRARNLEVKEVFDLYETRLAVELAIVDLACERASPSDTDEMERHLDAVRGRREAAAANEILAGDETFHELIAQATGNHELLALLRNVNARIHFTRWISTQGQRNTDREHRELVAAIREGDRIRAGGAMRAHIAKRLDQIVEIIRDGHAALGMRLAEAGARGPIIKRRDDAPGSSGAGARV
jgi:DNA-binding GntR family transcriptional regulator